MNQTILLPTTLKLHLVRLRRPRTAPPALSLTESAGVAALAGDLMPALAAGNLEKSPKQYKALLKAIKNLGKGGSQAVSLIILA